MIRTLVGWLLGFLVGMGAAMVIFAGNNTREMEVPTIICPPILEAALTVDMTATYQGMPPDMTDLDWEFAELCGLEWGEPYYEEPPESGA